MPRTDKQIADYMKYYAGRGNKELQWALENLAKVEGKTPEEIREICERTAKPKQEAEKKPKHAGGRPEIPRDEIRAELLAGGTLCSVAEKLGISSTTVGRIRVEMVKEGLLKAGRPYPGRKKDRQPEAYPGQINDGEPEIEDDVKAYVPGELKQAEEQRSAVETVTNAFQSLADSLHDALFGKEEPAGPVESRSDNISLLIDLVTFARDKFGDIVLDEVYSGSGETRLKFSTPANQYKLVIKEAKGNE